MRGGALVTDGHVAVRNPQTITDNRCESEQGKQSANVLLAMLDSAMSNETVKETIIDPVEIEFTLSKLYKTLYDLSFTDRFKRKYIEVSSKTMRGRFAVSAMKNVLDAVEAKTNIVLGKNNSVLLGEPFLLFWNEDQVAILSQAHNSEVTEWH